MASTFTTNFAIEKPGTGEQSGTWGTTTNHNFDIFDRLAGYKSVTLSNTSSTLTIRPDSPSSGSSNAQDGMFRAITSESLSYANNCVRGVCCGELYRKVTVCRCLISPKSQHTDGIRSATAASSSRIVNNSAVCCNRCA